ncbi:MAG: branched-chain amino acid ABC transporter permease [Anaerolineae bacterium]|nr:branched-chain amino acid ABC transporter permease [Anaerolineae bacterium]
MAVSTKTRARTSTQFELSSSKLTLWVIAVLVIAFIVWRLAGTLAQGKYGPDVWILQTINGSVQGAMYALIALGYTLVYGILFMINFAHGEIFMIGAMAGYFTLTGFDRAGVLDTNPLLAVLVTFLVGMLTPLISGIFLERLAYRPLRRAPRLVPLISAIGASFFLQQAARLLFGIRLKVYPTVDFLAGAWVITVGGKDVRIQHLGVVIIIVTILLMIGLYVLVQRTKIGKAMRAVAEDKDTAALMGIDVNYVIMVTFAIGSALAGAAGVMWGLWYKQVIHTVGFMPGLKAFTAAVLGGIGNIPGAMLGGFFLGLVESIAPTALNLNTQLKDVLAFGLLVIVLIFRPSGLLGEVLSGKKA